uniref:Radical SAM superfamily protein n=1 Tax=viral metagenome TaxID=1070528 RepID=A0A6M3XP70_9ZZZZ
MNKTKIEWCDYTINPVKGLCPMACEYCYARAMYKRFKWNPEIRFEPLDYIKYPAEAKVFIGSTMELFGEWVKESWLDQVFEWCRRLPEVTFIFLTKKPQKLEKWSPFPENAWVGQTLTAGESDYVSLYNRMYELEKVEAKVKFISFEPLQGRVDLPNIPFLEQGFRECGINWVIIGAQTPRSEKTFPKWQWVREIIEAADKSSIPVFLKPNLGLLEYSCEGSAPFYRRHQSGTWKLMRQELPAPVVKE